MFRSPQAGDWADDEPEARPAPSQAPQPAGRATGRWAEARAASDRFERSNSGSGGNYGGNYGGGGGGGRWERNAEPPRDRERGDGFGRREQARGPPMPVERGFVVSMRENFGFISGIEREGDLFFHVTEAPVDVRVGDEVEFRVKFNQRSQKDLAVQVVVLPKGSIVMEDVRGVSVWVCGGI